MHRKAVFALAGVFLAIALIVPPIALITQADSDLDNYVKQQNNPTHSTGEITTFIDELNENHQNTYIIVFTLETIFVILFAVTVYFGIRH
jgi:hypothetical protein